MNEGELPVRVCNSLMILAGKFKRQRCRGKLDGKCRPRFGNLQEREYAQTRRPMKSERGERNRSPAGCDDAVTGWATGLFWI